MPSQHIIETFNNHGIKVKEGESSTYLVRKLRKVDPESLWILLEEFTNGGPIGMDSPNERMHRLTISYALVDIFENDKELITQDDIDVAFKRAGGTAERVHRGSSTCSNEELPENIEKRNNGDSTQKKATSRKRDTGLRPLITSLVGDNPKASAAEIITMVQEQKPHAKENTIRVYYSQARKELNLASNAKRGRKPSGLYPSIKKMIQDNPEISKEKVVAKAVKKFGAKENTVAVYISKARKELEL